MKKNLLLLIIFNLFFFIIPATISAEDYSAVITGSSVQIREGAGKENKSLASLGINTSISVVDKTLYEGSGCDSKWYKVNYKNLSGYVCSKYVRFVDTTYNGINVIDWKARVNGNNVAVRSKASSSSTSIDTLSLGVNVTILEEVDGSNSYCSTGKWYKIQYYGNKVGYMCKNYIIKKEDITSNDEEYSKKLKEDGFNDSYIPYLNYLHSKYPNWSFVPKKTNINFAVAVDSEEGKNYMQTTNDNYRTSSTPAEGSSWFKVNSEVISFYMDPRNWLNEERIFMFEKQDYSQELEDKYYSLVKAIFGTGKLSDDMYVNPIINAGKANKVSPVLIASRIRLEVGANGSDSTNGGSFTWKGQTYSGYYNFFNIGAYEVTIDGVKYSSITRGLAYAAKLINRDGQPWNNIETALTEGSAYLTNGYVTKGQGTLYYQKFNVSPDAAPYNSSFTHQYMTNIQAPAIEGNKSYEAYKEKNTLNEPFVFEIPIYTNMPTSTSLPNSGDTNNNLKNLSVNGYSLTPKFDSAVLSYEVYVPKSITKVNIQATPSSNLSTITGNGETELIDDETTITVTITSQVGSEKKYTITIYRLDDTTKVEEVTNKMSIVINNNILTKFKNNTKIQDLKNSFIQSGATKIDIKDKSGNELSDSSILGTGSTITITTSVETKTFTVSVNGDTSGDGQITILDLLQIQKHIKGLSKLSGAYSIAADTSNDNQITILDLLQVQKHIKKIKLL